MGIGNRRLIQLIQISNDQQDDGRNSEARTYTINTWAEIVQGSGSSDYSNGKVLLETTSRFKVRFRFDKYPTFDWAIKYLGKEWAVSEIRKMDEGRFYYMITATSKSAA